MNSKRMPIALSMVAVIVSVVFPVQVAAQGRPSSPVAPRREVVAAVCRSAAMTPKRIK